MNYLQKIQELVVETMEDDLPGNLTTMGTTLSVSLKTPHIEQGFVDPVVSVQEFPALHVYGIEEGDKIREHNMIPLSVQLFHIIQESKDVSKKINGAMDAIRATLEALPGGDIYDVQNIRTNIYYGPSDVKQMAVGTVDFDVLLNL